MKMLLVMFFCCVAFGAGGQILTEYPNGASAQSFKLYYGSLAEYNMQEGMKFRSTHKRSIMCIGAKAIYLKEIAIYMAESLGCSKKITGDDEDYPTAWLVEPSGIFESGDDISPVRIISDFDDSLRMTKVTITGNTDLLIKLFVYYWYRSELKFDINKIKKGCLVYQDSGSDRISFNWKGAKPNITITKNSTFSIPLPIVAERS